MGGRENAFTILGVVFGMVSQNQVVGFILCDCQSSSINFGCEQKELNMSRKPNARWCGTRMRSWTDGMRDTGRGEHTTNFLRQNILLKMATFQCLHALEPTRPRNVSEKTNVRHITANLQHVKCRFHETNIKHSQFRFSLCFIAKNIYPPSSPAHHTLQILRLS